MHDMMDDIAEQQDVAREISDAISNPVAFGQDIDEVIKLSILGCQRIVCKNLHYAQKIQQDKTVIRIKMRSELEY